MICQNCGNELKEEDIRCIRCGSCRNVDLLTDIEGKMAVRLARGAIENAILKKPKLKLNLTPAFQDKRGVIVTLKKDATTRGCMGFPVPTMPLVDTIEHSAITAALKDPRSPSIKKDELPYITIEIMVLTQPKIINGVPAQRPDQIIVGKHGLLVRGKGRTGMIFPTIATESQWDAKTFLSQTCKKAGLGVGTRRRSGPWCRC